MNNPVRFVDEKQEQRWRGTLSTIPSKGHRVTFNDRSGIYRVSGVHWRMNIYGCNVTVYVEEV